MKVRWEVTEQQWVETFSGSSMIDYLVLDLEIQIDRPWLEEARTEVELIGRAPGAIDSAMLDRALELDVDFLCLSAAGEGIDPKRLPLRLIVEEQLGAPPALVGAAWARRILGWEGANTDTLGELARGERIFLAPPAHFPSAQLLASAGPFAAGVPSGCSVAELQARSLR